MDLLIFEYYKMIHLKREINKNIKQLNRLKNDIEKIMLKIKKKKQTNLFMKIVKITILKIIISII